MNKTAQYLFLTGLSSAVAMGCGRESIPPMAKSVAKEVVAGYKTEQKKNVVKAGIANGTMEPQGRAEKPMEVYSDGKLAPEWQDWSWAKHTLNSNDSGKSALKFEPKGYEGVMLHRGNTTLEGYGTLEFLVLQGTDSDIRLALIRSDSKTYAPSDKEPAVLLRHFVADAKREGNWLRVRIPLSKFPLQKGEEFSGLVFQANTQEPQSPLFINNVRFLPDTNIAPPSKEITVAVTVETGQDKHVISPLIYGMAFAPKKYLTDLRLGMNRWGGNDKSRYNWAHGNAVNAAGDWEFRNRIASEQFPASAPTRPSLAADAFIDTNNSANVQTMITIPTIGWVAKNNDNNARSEGVPQNGTTPLSGTESDLGKIDGYNATANRQTTSVKSVARKNAPFSESPSLSGPIAQDEWVGHLTKKYGNATTKTGVKFYAMDNEPDLWFNTHRDITPGAIGYDQILSRYQEYASAVKDVDPSAMITGPVSWGWTGYEYSPLDMGTDTYRSAPDQRAHGGKKLLPWFLAQMKAYDTKHGKRTLDVLDIHYYPQSNLYGNPDLEAATQARRLRATQALWASGYTDESWIGKEIRLIPLMKDWINENYPGTKLGITEWNFGGDNHINGALAIAETLGIYAREDVYMACYWAYPNDNTPGYHAFKLLRNPDGAGTGFGDISCRATSDTPLKVGAYAALDSKTKEVTVLLINKAPKASATVPLKIAGMAAGQSVRYWQLGAVGDDGKTTQIKPGTLKVAREGQMTIEMPPYCAMLLRIAPVAK
jgi:Glycoside hydrolase family 44